MLLFEVGVEERGHVADEDAAEERDANLVGGVLDQAVFDEGSEAREFGREVLVEIDVELDADGRAVRPR